MVWIVAYDELEGKDEEGKNKTCLTVSHLNKDDNDELQLNVVYTLLGDEADTIARIIAFGKK